MGRVAGVDRSRYQPRRLRLEDAPHHAAAKRSWEDCLSGTEPIGLAWVVLLGFGPNHLDILSGLLEGPVGPNLVTDAHLAALAIEHQAELHSNDSDFSRFSGLAWRIPVA